MAACPPPSIRSTDALGNHSRLGFIVQLGNNNTLFSDEKEGAFSFREGQGCYIYIIRKNTTIRRLDALPKNTLLNALALILRGIIHQDGSIVHVGN